MSLINIIANDPNIIPYRKELNSLTGSVLTSILLVQMVYRFVNNGNKPFYKFKIPNEHELYKEGDSWTEELGFSRREFDTAYKKLEYLGIVSKKTNMHRVTYYSVEIVTLDKLLKSLYIKADSATMESANAPLEQYTENTTENTHILERSSAEKQKSEFTFSLKKNSQYQNLSEEYKKKLKGYAVVKDGSYQLEKFINYHASKGSTFKNWSMAYNTWVGNASKYDANYNIEQCRRILSDHPKFSEVHVEYGTNNIYNTNYELCGIFALKKETGGDVAVSDEEYNDKINPKIGKMLGGINKNS